VRFSGVLGGLRCRREAFAAAAAAAASTAGKLASAEEQDCCKQAPGIMDRKGIYVTLLIYAKMHKL